MQSSSQQTPIIQNQQVSKLSETLFPFLFASISSCTATAVIQPIDTVKVRMQIAGENKGLGGASSTQAKSNVITTATNLVQKEGYGALYNGLSSALLRQFTYGTIRIGVYRYLFDKEAKINKSVSFNKKFLFSLTSGAVGSFFGNPFDVVLVRMQADNTLPADQRRNYRGVGDAFTRMLKEEGLTSFWKGYLISLLRAVSMTSVMLTTNDEVKELVNKFRGIKKSDTTTNLLSAAVSGIACSFCSLPFDNVKTKLQKMKPAADGSMPYNGVVDCFRKTFRREGLSGFWSGYSAFYMRVAPHAMILLMVDSFLHRTFNPHNKH